MFGLLILVISAGFFVYSYQYHGMAGEAGPGMFPRMIACVTGIISVILMIGAFVGEKKPDIIEGEKNTDHKVFWCSLVLVALYVITWKYVPFMIRTENFPTGHELGHEILQKICDYLFNGLYCGHLPDLRKYFPDLTVIRRFLNG